MPRIKVTINKANTKRIVDFVKSLKKKPESDKMKEIQSDFQKLIHILNFDIWINHFEIVTGENDR